MSCSMDAWCLHFLLCLCNHNVAIFSGLCLDCCNGRCVLTGGTAGNLAFSYVRSVLQLQAICMHVSSAETEDVP